MKISIVIPTHDMSDKEDFLHRSLEQIFKQTYKDFEVCVSDNSNDDKLEKVCEEYGPKVKYKKNPKKGMAPNTNAAIKMADGELIKILYLDDYLAHEKALQDIVDMFKGDWLVTGCVHSRGDEDFFNVHYAEYNDDIHTGKNTIGSPSVLTIRNKNPLLFDEEMTWLLDCDYYKRLHEAYGDPVIVDTVNVVMGIGAHQTTEILSEDRKNSEHKYMKKKYAKN